MEGAERVPAHLELWLTWHILIQNGFMQPRTLYTAHNQLFDHKTNVSAKNKTFYIYHILTVMILNNMQLL